MRIRSLIDRGKRSAPTRAFRPSKARFGRRGVGAGNTDSIIAARAVPDLDAAVEHIRTFGSDHTDCIITTDDGAANRFVATVDSAIVTVNASTQFADGGEFGMGAEIGIATGRLHARGPVGARQLTSFKYVVRGDGAVRR